MKIKSWYAIIWIGFGIAFAAGCGFAFARTTGFELLCKRQILCAVSQDSAWASQIHLSWQESPSRSLTVTWRTASDNNPEIIEYRQSGSEAWQQAQASATPMPANGLIAHRGTLHRATLTGLEPDTGYEYRVSNDRSAERPMSAPVVTRTAPEGRDAHFSFLFLADTGLTGRPDGLASATEQIRALTLDSNVLFLLGGGDYAYGNSDGRFVFPMDAADEWFRQWQPVLSRFPLMAQYGNHESFLRENVTQWLPRFGHPAGFEDGSSYSFDVGCTHFAAMFSPGDGYLPPRDQIQWLEKDLERANQAGACWRIVFQHDSLFAHGRSHPSDSRLRDLMTPVFERHAVDLVLTAQDQSYERTFPLRHGTRGLGPVSSERSNYRAGDGVIYAKVSPAGKRSERTHDFSLFERIQGPEIAIRSDTGHHYGRLSVEGPDSLKVDVFELKDGAEAPFVLDSFVIAR